MILRPNQVRLARYYLANKGLRLHISRKPEGEPALHGANWWVTDENDAITAYGSREQLAELVTNSSPGPKPTGTPMDPNDFE